MGSESPIPNGRPAAGEAPPGVWRFRVGVTVFVIGFAAPLAIPLVTAAKLPAAWKTVLAGALAVGVPEVMMAAAAAVMGRQGFAELKRRFGRLLRTYGPPQRVSGVRYRVGLVLFTLPLLLAWLGPYLGHHLPGYRSNQLAWAVMTDAVFVASIFVLGGEFWDKLRALFVHGARAVFPGTTGGSGGNHE